ncbi:hypothetical protein [Planomicrobium sp. CPCC 101079]|uniref:hypothetical protein n=1 Tax=Planomicrobium sp. CPCC 101079 TaxID=2599618 RepID=UPI0011B54C2A|nr:hypothetical protein [Planomicrobium sp. CPCC 101079]TWT01590.1 hypothetical protein FQV28_16090 [Planomicrobium sp. CPCC 101079]
MPYTWFYIIIGLILLIILSNSFLPLWLRTLIGAYYLVIAAVFVTETNRINAKYEGITPVPDAYWDENSAWVETASNFIFLPFIGLLIFIYIKWFMKVQTKIAKTLVLVSLLPAACVIFFFLFMFNFGYGYRP